MAAPRFSFQNLLSGASITTCATLQSSGYCSSQAAAPERPFLPWRTTTSTAAQAVVFDLGAATVLDLIAVVRTNFASLQLQGNTTSTWSAPPFDSGALTVTRNPYTGRLQYLYAPVGFNYRFLRLLIPSQLKTLEKETDAAVEYFSVGGVWAGLTTGPPSHLRYPVEVRTVEPHSAIGPDHGGWEQWLSLGEPRTVISADRVAYMTPATPGLSDDLRTVLALDKRMRERDKFLFDMNLGDPSQAWVVRRRSDSIWRLLGTLSEGPAEYAEVLGP